MITTHNIEDQTNSLADYLPNGSLFRSKKTANSKLRNMLFGLGYQLLSAEQKLITTEYNLDINTSIELIEEWESMVKIPCSCFSGTGTIAERRRDVLIKLNTSVQTEEDFLYLANLLGISIDITSGISFSTFPIEFPWIFFDSGKDARFTMVVDFNVSSSNSFPLIFPFTFDDQGTEIVRCLFNKLKPANVNIIYREVM